MVHLIDKFLICVFRCWTLSERRLQTQTSLFLPQRQIMVSKSKISHCTTSTSHHQYSGSGSFFWHLRYRRFHGMQYAMATTAKANTTGKTTLGNSSAHFSQKVGLSCVGAGVRLVVVYTDGMTLWKKRWDQSVALEWILVRGALIRSPCWKSPVPCYDSCRMLASSFEVQWILLFH